jgi:hypothetical protein
MNGRERIKRPTPERTGPVRNWSTLFGPPASTGAQNPRERPGQGGPPFPGMPEIPFPFPVPNGAPFPFPGAPGKAVSQGVATGYQVIDGYLRQGQNVARAMWGGGSLGPGRGPSDPPQLMESLTRQASQLAGMWFDMINLVVPGSFGGYGAPPTGTAGPFWMGGSPPSVPAWPSPARGEPPPPRTPAPQAATHSGEPTAVVVEVESVRPTEVSLELRSRSLGLSLHVHDLRAPETEKPRLTDVAITTFAEEERVKVTIRVPEGHPAGIYSGIILDEQTSLPRGTLTVRVG